MKSGQKLALECFRYLGRHIVWVGLSSNPNGYVQVYHYNTDTDEFKELVHLSVRHMELNPTKLHLLKNKFYYTGEFGKVMSLKCSV